MVAEKSFKNKLNPLLTEHFTQIQEACRRFEVEHLYVFGSINSNRFTELSDIDFIVQFKELPQTGYFDNYMNLHYRLSEILNRKIDLITADALKNDSNPYFNIEVEKTKQLIFNGQ